MSKTFDQIPAHDRPREKLLRSGAPALSDQELLAILLAKGTTKIDVMTLAQNLIQVVDAKGLNLKVDDIEHLEGMGSVKAMTIVAALEFARRRIKPEGAKRSRMVYDGDFILSNSMSFGHPYIMKTMHSLVIDDSCPYHKFFDNKQDEIAAYTVFIESKSKKVFNETDFNNYWKIEFPKKL